MAEATEEATVGRCICAGFSPIFMWCRGFVVA